MRIQYVGNTLTKQLGCAVLLTPVALILLSGCASFPNNKDEITGPNGNTDSTIIEPNAVNVSNDESNPSSVEVAGPVPSGIVQAPLDLKICNTRVSNAPLAVERQVSRSSATGCLNGVPLLVAPAPEACLTSGFGPRRGRLHKGIDLQSRPAGNVVAAASGEVIISKDRKQDYGNWIVIDHGSDVYTAYAHLASVNPSISKGAKVTQNQTLGVMGKTGGATSAVHLHYEIRQGKLVNNNFFGLTPVDPFGLDLSCPPS